MNSKEFSLIIEGVVKDKKPITPKHTRFLTPDYSKTIPGFDGFEAICFYNDIVYVTIEAEYEGLMYGYLIWGRISSDNYDINNAFLPCDVVLPICFVFVNDIYMYTQNK